MGSQPPLLSGLLWPALRSEATETSTGRSCLPDIWDLATDLSRSGFLEEEGVWVEGEAEQLSQGPQVCLRAHVRIMLADTVKELGQCHRETSSLKHG